MIVDQMKFENKKKIKLKESLNWEPPKRRILTKDKSDRLFRI